MYLAKAIYICYVMSDCGRYLKLQASVVIRVIERSEGDRIDRQHYKRAIVG